MESNANTPKRRRTVTACSECQRRKQKCNRQSPCSLCIERGVPGKCSYDHRPVQYRKSKSVSAGNQADESSNSTEFSLVDSTERSNAHLGSTSDLGYSLGTDTNSLVDLRKFLPSDRDYESVLSTHNAPPQTSKHNDITQWNQYLPRLVLIQQLVAIYFKHFNPQYFILEQYFFNQLFNTWLNHEPVSWLAKDELVKELHSFPAILFQILGLAMQVIPPDSEILCQMSRDELVAAKKYSDIGVEFLSGLGAGCINLTTVQSYLLRTSWLKNIGRGSESWHSLAVAVRQAQDMRLHESSADMLRDACESAEVALSHFWYKEYKRRVWANLFIFDGLMALILGRPRMINIDDCTVEPPLDCDIPDDPSRTIPNVRSSRIRNEPTTTSATLFRVELTCVVHDMRRHKATSPYPKDYTIISQLHDRIKSIMDSAPPYLRQCNPNTSYDLEYPHLRQHREDLLTLANLVLMSLHRPHAVSRVESRKAALQASITTLESQQRIFMQTPTHLHSLFGFSFYTIDAAISLCVMVGTNMPSQEDVKDRVEHILRQAIARLKMMEVVSPVARSGSKILQQCFQNLGFRSKSTPPLRPVEASAPETTEHATVDSMLSAHTVGSRNDTSSQVADTSNALNTLSTSDQLDEPALGEPSMIDLTSFDTTFWLDHMHSIPTEITDTNVEQGLSWDFLAFDP